LNRNHFFALAGNIGVGKTTWTKLLSEQFNWQPYYERFVENPYLIDFYENMREWSFHSQIYFLTHRFKAQLEIQKSRKTCIQDRTIFEDGEIFARNLYEQKLMNERDYHSYRELFEAMLESLIYPDLIIYLKASTWTLISRIRKRGRDYESKIDKEYLARLNTIYDKWIESYSRKYRVLVVDTDNFDIQKDEHRLTEIINEIKMYEKQLELFPNLGYI
jgi:deoxyadenosine/deoxycytidine kinase